MASIERRRWVRVPTGGIPVFVDTGDGGPAVGRLLDVSLGGAKVRVPWDVDPGGEVSVRVPAPEPRRPDEEALVTGEVVRTTRRVDGRAILALRWDEAAPDPLWTVLSGWWSRAA